MCFSTVFLVPHESCFVRAPRPGQKQLVLYQITSSVTSWTRCILSCKSLLCLIQSLIYKTQSSSIQTQSFPSPTWFIYCPTQSFSDSSKKRIYFLSNIISFLTNTIFFSSNTLYSCPTKSFYCPTYGKDYDSLTTQSYSWNIVQVPYNIISFPHFLSEGLCFYHS